MTHDLDTEERYRSDPEEDYVRMLELELALQMATVWPWWDDRRRDESCTWWWPF